MPDLLEKQGTISAEDAQFLRDLEYKRSARMNFLEKNELVGLLPALPGVIAADLVAESQSGTASHQ